MFVELYRTNLEYVTDDNGSFPRDVGIISTNTVIHVNALVSICMIPTEVNSKNYYKVRVVQTAGFVETQFGKLYITESDYKRLIH